jgi:GTPase
MSESSKSQVKLIDPVQYPRTLILGILTPYNASGDTEGYFTEFRSLVQSNNIDYVEEFYIKLRSIDPGYFITKGKLAELAAVCKEKQIEEVVVSEHLSNQQVSNLRKILHARVFDRTELILDIFEKHAVSAEGKLQVELAAFRHKKSRLTGRGIHMAQQAGHIGGKGPGETQKEKEIQSIERRITRIRRDLERLAQVRATQRKQRLISDVPLVCLIGYTNAGKSSIMNALTHGNVLVEDKLFATLDTTSREFFVGDRKIGVLSDTVGFIQQLPHGLVEAFKSTLQELTYAHLLLHVVDIASPNWQQHIDTVNQVIGELGVQDKPMLYVFNKVDVLTAIERTVREEAAQNYLPHCFVSAVTDNGLADLEAKLLEWSIKRKPAR